MAFMPPYKCKLRAAGAEEYAGRAIKKHHNREWSTEHQMEHVLETLGPAPPPFPLSSSFFFLNQSNSTF